jgi:AraC family transcriptional regulator, regulatory protein of adaptative response / methylated-DNA-[protein]-cysteine methyltransferase
MDSGMLDIVKVMFFLLVFLFHSYVIIHIIKLAKTNFMKQTSFDTPLGVMLAVADEEKLYLLAFADYLDKPYRLLTKQTQFKITPGITEPLRLIEHELDQYFAGKLIKFTTPIVMTGSAFQKSVWEELKQIPLGETRSYGDIAKLISKPNSYRAVANANGANKFAIIIPCHRVINSNGHLGGYSSGLYRKQWLIIHEFGIPNLYL